MDLTQATLFIANHGVALPTVFSAGVDLTEISKPDLKRLQLFGTMLQEVWIKLIGFPYATAAAINGHAPAGGCILALACEHRAMVSGNYTIGLNETGFGLVPEDWFIETMSYTIRMREAELALTTGKLFTVDEALEVGLIDETASDKADAIEKCKTFIRKFDKILPSARTMTKLRMRQRPLANMEKNRQKYNDEMVEFVLRPELQQQLDNYMKSLKARKLAK